MSEARSDAEVCNAFFRARLGQPLSGADLQDLAERFGVTVREVQRWVTAAEQQRNAIPLSLYDVPFGDWPSVYQDRCLFATIVTVGLSRPAPPDCQPEQYVERFQSLSDAETYARAMDGSGDLDPWTEQTWIRIVVEKSETGWNLRVTYCRFAYKLAARTPSVNV